MPIDWKISHDDQTVEVVASGPVGLPDIERYFDAVTVAGAWSYRKLFDAVHATPAFGEDDMMMLGARISAYVSQGPVGPLAIAASADMRYSARLFAALAAAKRPLKIFKSVHAARKWLAAQPIKPPSTGTQSTGT